MLFGGEDGGEAGLLPTVSSGAASFGNARPPISPEHFRARVSHIYTKHEPSKLSDLDLIVQKFGDDPWTAIDKLEDKYGIPRGTSGDDMVDPRPQVSDGATTNPVSVPQQQEQNVAPPAITPSADPPRLLEAAPPTTSFGGGSTQQLEPQPSNAGGAASPFSPAVDLASLRTALSEDQGFLNQDHERKWEEAWHGQIRLSTMLKSGPVVMQATGLKHTKAMTRFGRWQKRHFVIIPPFLYYFEKNEPTAPCRGGIYLPRAKVTEKHVGDKTGIEVEPRVQRKPAAQGSGPADFSAFLICFEPARLHSAWFGALSQLTVLTAQPEPPLGGTGPQQSTLTATSIVAGAGEDPRTTLEARIPKSELFSRIQHLVESRDMAHVCETLLECIDKNVEGTLPLWRLMESLEKLPPTHPPNDSFVGSQGGAGGRRASAGDFEFRNGLPRSSQSLLRNNSTYGLLGQAARGGSNPRSVGFAGGPPSRGAAAVDALLAGNLSFSGFSALGPGSPPQGLGGSSTLVGPAVLSSAPQRAPSSSAAAAGGGDTMPPERPLDATLPQMRVEDVAEVQSEGEDSVKPLSSDPKQQRQQPATAATNTAAVHEELALLRQSQAEMERRMVEMCDLVHATSLAHSAMQEQLIAATQQQQQQEGAASGGGAAAGALQHSHLPSYAIPRTSPQDVLLQRQQSQLVPQVYSASPQQQYGSTSVDPYASPMQRHQQQSSPVPGFGSPSATLAERIERVRSRRRVIDGLVRDLPSPQSSEPMN